MCMWFANNTSESREIAIQTDKKGKKYRNQKSHRTKESKLFFIMQTVYNKGNYLYQRPTWIYEFTVPVTLYDA